MACVGLPATRRPHCDEPRVEQHSNTGLIPVATHAVSLCFRSPRKRDYEAEAAARRLRPNRVPVHPLQPGWSKRDDAAQPSPGAGTPTPSSGAGDPLGASGSSGAAAAAGGAGGAGRSGAQVVEVGFDPLSSAPVRKSVVDFDPLGALGGGGFGGAGGAGGPAAKSSGGYLANATIAAPDAKAAAKKKAKLAAKKKTAKYDYAAKRATFPWHSTKQTILKEFAVSGKIRVTAGLVSDVKVDAGDEQKTVRLDKARARLERLERPEDDVGDTVEVTQAEYVDRITRLKADLEAAWVAGQRVRSLKIAIKCAKLLLDSDIPGFYPTIFVLVTDILDLFGDLVFDRIFQKALESRSRIDGAEASPITPDNYSASDISAEARETCRNWVFKVACIRELVPRLYIEMALLRCYGLLSDDEYPSIVSRLCSTIRGIGDPLVAIFARTYLARVTDEVMPGTLATEKMVAGLMDYLFSFREMKSERWTAHLEETGMSQNEVLAMHEPAVEWVMDAAARDKSKDTFTAVLSAYREHCGSSMVLKHILRAFPGSHFSMHAASLVTLIKEATESNVSEAEVYAGLASSLVDFPPPRSQRMSFLNDSWRVITRMEDPVRFAKCAATYAELLMRHYSEREVNILLRDLVRHLHEAMDAAAAAADVDDLTPAGRAKLPDACVPPLERVMELLTRGAADARSGGAGAKLGNIITTESFMELMDLFPADRKTILCKQLMDSFTKTHGSTSDPVVIHAVLDMGRTLHDGLDSLSVEDERRQIGSIISRFIHQIDFGRDLEQQLHVLVDCRAAFFNLDVVKDHLVSAAATLAMRAHKLMKGRHSKKTTAFVKACLAFAHITIPSIDNPFSRMALFQQLGQVAIVNQCLPQADTFFKSVIQEIPDLPAVLEIAGKSIPTEAPLEKFLRGFLAALVVVPGHPDHGPFYLAQGLMKAMARYPWSETSGARTRVYICMLPLFAAFGQRKLPYHVARLESNDAMYAGDDRYMADLRDFISTTMTEIVGQLTTMGEKAKSDPVVAGRQAEVIVDLLTQLIVLFELDGSGRQLCQKFAALARKNGGDIGGLKALFDLVARRAEAAEAAGESRHEWAGYIALNQVLRSS